MLWRYVLPVTLCLALTAPLAARGQAVPAVPPVPVKAPERPAAPAASNNDPFAEVDQPAPRPPAAPIAPAAPSGTIRGLPWPGAPVPPLRPAHPVPAPAPPAEENPFGDEPPSPPLPPAAPAARQTEAAQRPHASEWAEMMLRNCSIGQMTVVSGRIVTTQPWQQMFCSPRNGEEEVRIQSTGMAGLFHYERTSQGQPGPQLLLELLSDGHFTARYANSADPAQPQVQLVQRPGEPLVLTVGAQEYRAPSLWHFMVRHPEVYRQHLAPLLELLPGLAPVNAKLKQVGESLETELLKPTVLAKSSDWQRWTALVQQLGHDDYAKREAADRLLRQAGPAVLGCLQQLDYTSLDAEQQFRVRRIIDSFHGQDTEDTADKVVLRMVDDLSIWFALLDRPQEATRRAAAKQLAALLGESIGVDPAVNPAAQKGQREQLWAKIEQTRLRARPQ